MEKKSKSVLAKAAFATFALLALGSASFSQAAAPVSSSSVNFCVNKKTLAVTQRTTCKPTERTLAMNQVGPTGPAGPMGASTLPHVYIGSSVDPTRASGVQVTSNVTPLPVWVMPSDGRYLVTQNFVVNAFPVNRESKVEVQCFIGDTAGYFSAVSITAVPDALPVGASTFNTGYGSVTYVTAGIDRYVTPYCKNMSNDTNVFVASFTAAATKVSAVDSLPAQ